MPLQGHCLNVGAAASSVSWGPYERQGLCHSGFGTANANNEVAMEAETQIDMLGEIADLDPDPDGLIES